MKKGIVFLLLFFTSNIVEAQVGINTTLPNAQLDIRSSNQASPSNTDGILIPKVNVFPAINPTAAQQGMLVYLTTTSGTDLPGFYYWDNTTVDWKPIAGTAGVTLDQAYDFGGAGNGKTITADAGAVLINGTDGLVSTGIIGSGAIAPSGAGTKMFWNPRKAAFRVGQVYTPKWDDVNLGTFSVAFGLETLASGDNSTAFGTITSAIGEYSTAFGYGTSANGQRSIAFGHNTNSNGSGSTSFGFGTTASGTISTAFGASTIASGNLSTAFGQSSNAIGDRSTAFGYTTFANGALSTVLGMHNTASSYAETVIGIGATNYTPSLNGVTQANPTDRLFVIGNAIDTDNNNFIDVLEQSDAMIVLKNGLTRLPSTTNAMITAADGKAVVTKEYLLSTTSGTLDQAYDFGGAGNGKTITADAGAVTIGGTDGFVATGTFGSGAIAPSGAGTRMVWNPRKGAFRAGNSVGNEWDDVSIGNYSVAFGLNNTASATYSFASGIGNTASSYSSFATGFNTVASGDLSTTFGYETVASGEGAVAFGSGSDATGYFSTAFGSATLASGVYATAFGNSTTASAGDSAAFGTQTTASAPSSVAFGNQTIANGPNSASFGQQSSASGNVSFSFGQNTGANAWYSAAFGYWSNSSGETSFVAGRYSRAWGYVSSCFGESSAADGDNSFATGKQNTALGVNSTIFGHNATAFSFGETVLGIGATAYAPSLNGNTQFRTANATDRLFVIGNAIDANNNDVVDAAERSDAMVVLKNGNTGFGTSTPQSKVHVVGNLRMVDGNQAVGRVLTSDGNGTATWQNASANAWGLVGNAGTNAATNFIGTTDNVDLVFRRANVLSGRIGTSNTFLGRLSGSVSTANNNTYIGTEAGRDNVTGQQNVFIGRRAGTFGATGSDNILIGNGAGIFNEANQNCFIGSFSGNGTTTGANNSFYGDSSGLANGTGSQNAFFGASAGTTNTIGIGNTLLGTGSNVSANNLNNAAAIGFRSFVGANNSMVLGSVNGVNGATSSVNVGIGTTTPLDRLHVVGNIRMVDGNQAAGRVLTSDANGTATWQNASANAWGLVGNAGTNAATNFIGTTDNIDLVFRRGNIISGRLGDSNTFFGRNSGVVSTGTSNTFIGERAGIANVSGSSNTFLGRLAGSNGASGNDNTYLGYAAGLNNTGNGNVILGAFSSQNTTGSFNILMGFGAGSTNTIGSRNTTIGCQSDVGAANLTNATAIGNLAQVDASNSLVLGSINGVNGSLVSTNVGIGTTSPLTRLDIVDENTTTSNLVYGNLHVRSNNAQNIDIGGAITLGGYNDDTMVQPRVFGSVEGRKSNTTTNNSSGYLSFKTNNAGTLAERMRITNAGSVGIGTPTPGGLLELSLDQGRKPGTNTWTIVSDQRLKTINGKYTKGLNEILQLNPIRFNYKNNGERTFEQEVLETEFPGFIAQEVQPLFPDAIGTDDDGFLNFNIHPILIASVNAIKELNAKNTQLQSENQSLKAELDQQKILLESVLQRITQLEQK